MARVLLAGFDLDPAWSAREIFRSLANSASGRHQLVDDPTLADVVLFTEFHQSTQADAIRRIRSHPAYESVPSKIRVYDERDLPIPVFPGVYVSMPRRGFSPAHQRAWGYTPSTLIPDTDEESTKPDLLFSFIGSHSHKVRGAIYDLKSERAVVERIQDFVFFRPEESVDFTGRRSRYREVLARSKFVLCPRGAGTSSIRLYETMRAGRVPVIISDEWIPPDGPDWSKFSLRVPEAHVPELVPVLEQLEHRFEDMGALAHKEFEQWFGPDRYFDRLIDQIVELSGSASVRWPLRTRQYRSQVRLRLRVREARFKSREWFARQRGQQAS